jgi:molybdate transport system ATP-binding protein
MTSCSRSTRWTAGRPTGGPQFRGLTWAVREGETWAVVGPVASGKSTLGELIAGRLVVRSGAVRWPLLDRLRAAGSKAAYPSDLVHRVAFKEESRLFSYGKHYYQQRFNFVETDEDLSLGDYLRAGVVAGDRVRAVADRLGVGHLLGLSFLKLSNGQTRRARIARGLLTNPEVLVLDDPFVGVDASGRGEVSDILGGLAREGRRLVVITRPEELPGWVTHVLELDGMTVKRSGLVGWVQRRFAAPTHHPAGDANGGSALAKPSLTHPTRPDPVVELRDVSVAYAGTPVLDRVTWTVRAGERWAVLGPNGSGKTTLLSLLCGDHPQAYANDIRLFGRRRGTGESIWEIKQNVGLLTPELHLYFTEPMTAAQAAATGFADVVVSRPATPDQRAAVAGLFGRFGIADLAGRPFARLSTGEQRLVLLVRALVKRPPLLILDEPFQGLDHATILRARDFLDRELDPGQTVLFVTHHADEVPRTVTHRLRLDLGRVV